MAESRPKREGNVQSLVTGMLGGGSVPLFGLDFRKKNEDGEVTKINIQVTVSGLDAGMRPSVILLKDYLGMDLRKLFKKEGLSVVGDIEFDFKTE